jgi:hypothetical protein
LRIYWINRPEGFLCDYKHCTNLRDVPRHPGPVNVEKSFLVVLYHARPFSALFFGLVNPRFEPPLFSWKP